MGAHPEYHFAVYVEFWGLSKSKQEKFCSGHFDLRCYLYGYLDCCMCINVGSLKYIAGQSVLIRSLTGGINIRAEVIHIQKLNVNLICILLLILHLYSPGFNYWLTHYAVAYFIDCTPFHRVFTCFGIMIIISVKASCIQLYIQHVRLSSAF